MQELFSKIKIPNETAMLAVGAKLAAVCSDTLVIFLYGELGAGKTTFSRGFIQSLGHKGHVKSPTYTLVEPYQIGLRTLYHFDLYRLRDAAELDDIGIQDYFASNTICLIEWPEYGLDHLPSPDLSCYIEMSGHQRIMKVVPQSEIGKTILQRFEYE